MPGGRAPDTFKRDCSIPLARPLLRPTSAGQQAEVAPSKEPRADARRNRETVLEQAIEVLAQRPTATMVEIAEAAELGRTTVYRHFANRDELIESLFHRVVAEARQATGATIAAGGSTEETLHALGPTLISIGERFRFLHGSEKLGAEAFAESKEVSDDPVRLFLLERREIGEIREDVPLGWMQSMVQVTAMATIDEIRAGRMDTTEAGRLLGETFVRNLLANDS